MTGAASSRGPESASSIAARWPTLPNKLLTFFAAQRLGELARLEPHTQRRTTGSSRRPDRALAEVDALVHGAGAPGTAG